VKTVVPKAKESREVKKKHRKRKFILPKSIAKYE